MKSKIYAFLLLGIVFVTVPLTIAADDAKLAPYESGQFSLGIGYVHAFDLNVPLEGDPWLGTGGDRFIEAELGLFSMGKAVFTPRISAGYAYDMYWLDTDAYVSGTRMMVHSLTQEIGFRIGFPSGWYFGSAFVLDMTLGGMIYSPDSSELFTSENLGINMGVCAEVGYDIRLGKRSFLPIGIRAKAGLSLEDSIPLEFGLTLGYKHRLRK